MDPEVVFHPDAARELIEALAYYAARSRRVAERFAQEVHVALQWIADAPQRWPSHDGLHRRFLMRRFPYLVVYREHEGRLWIVAVAHMHRRPGYWDDRDLGGF